MAFNVEEHALDGAFWHDAATQLEHGAARFEEAMLRRLHELEVLAQHLGQRDMRLAKREAELAGQWHRLAELRQATDKTAEELQAEADRLAAVRLELDERQTTLSLQMQQWQLERTRAAAQAVDTSRDQEQRLALARALAELDEARAELARRQSAEPVEMADPQLAQRAALDREEVIRLTAELEAANAQTARLADAAVELAAARAELLELHSELTTRRHESENAQNQRIAQLEQERTELESELEAVRGRAADLIDEAEANESRVSVERSQWADELRQLRRSLEMQSQFLFEKGAIAAVPLEHPAPKQPPAQAWPTQHPLPDPVLDLVRAQFQHLQQERIVRRGASGVETRQEVA